MPETLLPVGQKVRFSDSFLERCAEPERRRFTGRVGEVHGYRAGASEPIVFFPRDGRRKEQKLFEVCGGSLELMSA